MEVTAEIFVGLGPGKALYILVLNDFTIQKCSPGSNVVVESLEVGQKTDFLVTPS